MPGRVRQTSGTLYGRGTVFGFIFAVWPGLPRLQTQHRLARDTAAVKFVRHLRDLLEGRLQLDLRMKPLRRDHRDEPRQSLRRRTMRKLVEADNGVEASPTGPHEGGRV